MGELFVFMFCDVVSCRNRFDFAPFPLALPASVLSHLLYVAPLRAAALAQGARGVAWTSLSIGELRDKRHEIRR